jgi:hypothetical protein
MISPWLFPKILHQVVASFWRLISLSTLHKVWLRDDVFVLGDGAPNSLALCNFMIMAIFFLGVMHIHQNR